MTSKEYQVFHDKFTKGTGFEFSHGIYLMRDYVRNREVNNNLLTEFIHLVKSNPASGKILSYLKEKNKNSNTTFQAISLIQKLLY